ncbi:hypothetical protein HHI36_023467 [Cryptolaemus montrouzieri]|uniref:Uncharacterized protein n=1 Tax=Cryptolaemus montrouzieri TaxID=559131 RepID=A0ABD2PGN8_9CUCU
MGPDLSKISHTAHPKFTRVHEHWGNEEGENVPFSYQCRISFKSRDGRLRINQLIVKFALDPNIEQHHSENIDDALLEHKSEPQFIFCPPTEGDGLQMFILKHHHSRLLQNICCLLIHLKKAVFRS